MKRIECKRDDLKSTRSSEKFLLGALSSFQFYFFARFRIFQTMYFVWQERAGSKSCTGADMCFGGADDE